MTNELKLKPCPFCGSPACDGMWFDDDDNAAVLCSNRKCCATGPLISATDDDAAKDFAVNADAAARWNHRPREEALEAMLREGIEAVEMLNAQGRREWIERAKEVLG